MKKLITALSLVTLLCTTSFAGKTLKEDLEEMRQYKQGLRTTFPTNDNLPESSSQYWVRFLDRKVEKPEITVLEYVYSLTEAAEYERTCRHGDILWFFQTGGKYGFRSTPPTADEISLIKKSIENFAARIVEHGHLYSVVHRTGLPFNGAGSHTGNASYFFADCVRKRLKEEIRDWAHAAVFSARNFVPEETHKEFLKIRSQKSSLISSNKSEDVSTKEVNSQSAPTSALTAIKKPTLGKNSPAQSEQGSSGSPRNKGMKMELSRTRSHESYLMPNLVAIHEKSFDFSASDLDGSDLEQSYLFDEENGVDFDLLEKIKKITKDSINLNNQGGQQ